MTDPSAKPPLFDRRLLRARRQRAIAGGSDGFLLKLAIDELQDRLALNTRLFETCLCLGDPSDTLAQSLRETGKTGLVISGDLCRIPSASADVPALELDEEALPFAGDSFDLIVSALSLQWANDLPSALSRLRRCLKPDGLFLGVMSGGQTLIELRTALHNAEDAVEGGVSPRIAPVADLRQIGDLLARAGFASPVADLDARTIRYDNALKLMHDLRAMGAGNVLGARRRTPLRRETLARALSFYQDSFSDADGRIRASFEMIFMSGWHRTES